MSQSTCHPLTPQACILCDDICSIMCSNFQANYYAENTAEQLYPYCISCYSILEQRSNLQANSNELSLSNNANHKDQHIDFEQQTSTSNRAARDKIYTKGITDVIIKIAHLCGVQTPKDGKFLKRPSKDNEHMSKKGILGKVEEWIINNKVLKEENEGLIEALKKKNEDLIEELLLKVKELERNKAEYHELRQKNRELQERYGVYSYLVEDSNL